MADADQLGFDDDRPDAPPSGEWFRTDDQLAMLLVDLEAVYRGALAKLIAVRRFLQHRDGEPFPEPDPHLMRLALEHLANADNWEDDGRLRGPHTPFEMAATALGRL